MSNGSAQRAVVLGGSIAGLLAARVLADFHGEVLVVDRDRFTGPGVRQSVPQGRHAHGLLARGQQAMEELFPGLTDELRGAGVPVGDVSARMRWYVGGHRLRPGPTGLLVVGAARPVLEHHVRARVAALPNVTFVEGHDIAGLAATADGGRVTGVHVQERAEGSEPRRLDAALVVDATGRGSRAPKWLRDLGYPEVPEERVKVDLAYTSRRYRLRTDPFTEEQSINVIATPATRAGRSSTPSAAASACCRSPGCWATTRRPARRSFWRTRSPCPSRTSTTRSRTRSRSLTRCASASRRARGGTTSSCPASLTASSSSATRSACSTRCTARA